MNWLNILFPLTDVRLRVRFWGEQGPGKIIRAANASEELQRLYPNIASYDIRCSIWHFYRYLYDMEKLVIVLVDNTNKALGHVVVNFRAFLKQKYVIKLKI